MIFFKKEAKQGAAFEAKQAENSKLLAEMGVRELCASEFVEVSGGADVGGPITVVL